MTDTAHTSSQPGSAIEAHTYFGPQREAHIAAANALVPDGFTSFADWAAVDMRPIRKEERKYST